LTGEVIWHLDLFDPSLEFQAIALDPPAAHLWVAFKSRDGGECDSATLFCYSITERTLLGSARAGCNIASLAAEGGSAFVGRSDGSISEYNWPAGNGRLDVITSFEGADSKGVTALLPTGTELIAGGEQGDVVVWGRDSELLERFTGHRRPVCRLLEDSSGSLYSVCPHSARRWNLQAVRDKVTAQEERLAELEREAQKVEELAAVEAL